MSDAGIFELAEIAPRMRMSICTDIAPEFMSKDDIGQDPAILLLGGIDLEGMYNDLFLLKTDF